ncbi:MAG: serine/threonine protein kinase [Thelocarpon impressellum]|nr:MAG: serine/threonine protein kinase [Thelocarpon impressellum]
MAEEGILHLPTTPDPVELAPAKNESTELEQQPQTVRFSSVNQEIEPVEGGQLGSPLSQRELSPEAQDELRNLTSTLTNSRLQGTRMSSFAFEPVSLPASRVPSNETPTQPGAPAQANLPRSSRRPSPPATAMHSPPLTPAGAEATLEKVHPNAATMTSQVSAPQNTPPPTSIGRVFGNENDQAPSASSSRPPSSGQASTRPTTISTGSSVVSSHPKHIPAFSIGPTGDSLPLSREPSPSKSASGSATPSAQPFPPPGDKDDPYARNKRPPQPRNLDGIDARFIFSAKDSKRHSSHGSSGALASRSDISGPEPKAADEKRHSHFSIPSFGSKKNLHDDGATSPRHGSATDLKRFFKLGHRSKRSQSPMSKAGKSSGTRTPPHQLPPAKVPFAEDHGLASKYGKFGKVLGSGAGGSVRLLKRSTDGVTFAVKEFRDRHAHETEKEYAKKVTAEFCIGSTLHHGNVIETLDIIHERHKWYEVMEFAPFDLFAAVMTANMTRAEVMCTFLQIVNGVRYLHSMGLAHRDLKLDNVVVSEQGIMKIIDFGSASVYRYPFENDIVLAQGIVGSDPYLAPEVYDQKKYDPQPVDIWSLAIIFCCMTLRRFPWKVPRTTDASYKLFVSTPNMTPERPKSMADLPSADRRGEGGSPSPSRQVSEESTSGTAHHRQHRHHDSTQPVAESEPASRTDRPGEHRQSSERPASRQTIKEGSVIREGTVAKDGTVVKEGAPSKEPSVIKGPWRLLRLLPRESRTIIGHMLEVDPKKRATLEAVLADPWVANNPFCHQEDGGLVVRAPGHIHTLEPSAPVSAVSSKK